MLTIAFHRLTRSGSTIRIGTAVLVLLAFSFADTSAVDYRGRQFVGISDFSSFSRQERNSELILTSPRLTSEILWDQLIVSWNAEMDASDYLKIQARGVYADHATQFYTLGLWSRDDSLHPRESVNAQKDADGNVLTDTLALNRRGAAVEIQLILGRSQKNAPGPRLKFLGLSFCDTRAKPKPVSSNESAWGKSIAVPSRSQLDYPGGEVWCSPTSTSMVLAHWSDDLKRPELNFTVPAVAKSVFDKNWPGTGNWPFNTAFAGGFAGIRAYVTRLSDLSEIEDWIAQGIPVIASVSYNVLKGQPKKSGDGHLIVCAGFTEKGDPIVNDPGVKENVRRVYPRERLAEAWAFSHHTVYLIYPERSVLPVDRFEHW